MARGMGLPHLPHPHGGHPLAGHPGVNGAPHLPTHHALTSSAGAVIGRPTSTPSTGSTNNAFNGKSWTHWRISGNRRPPKTRKQEWPPFEANTHARRATIYLLYVVVVVQFLGIQAAFFLLEVIMSILTCPPEAKARQKIDRNRELFIFYLHEKILLKNKIQSELGIT